MKRLLLSAVILSSIGLYAQVGINTTEPKTTLDVSYEDTWTETKPQGVSFPNLTTEQRSKFENTPKGTMIYNTDKDCIEIYRGVVNGVHQWQCLPDAGSSQAQSIAVSATGFEGQYISGVALTNANKVKFTLNNNSFNGINNVDFSNAVTVQNGVAGNIQVDGSANKEVTIAGGGVQELVYTLSGTPQEGAITAYFNHLGLQADQSTQVGLGSATIANRQQYVVSLKTDGATVQGKINNTDNKVTVQIPYTNGKGSYNAVSVAQTTAQGQDGDINDLTLTIPAGTFGVRGTLTATIEVGGADQEYKVKQLEPGKEYVIATFPVNMNGTQYNIELKGIGGILDKKYNELTDGRYLHKFIYLPVKGPDGRTWLNNNLGADYANQNSSVFDPTKQATSYDDYHAYGSLFQWGRVDDTGYELINWTSSTIGTPVKTYAGWKSGSYLPNYKNDPCPNGWRTPNLDELSGLGFAMSVKRVDFTSSDMRLPLAGWRDASVRALDPSQIGYYWSTTPDSGVDAWGISITRRTWTREREPRREGFSVRCLKD